MKKLLLLINLLFYSFFIISCQNKINAPKEKLNESQEVSNDSISTNDTIKTQKQISPIGTVGKADGQIKDTSKSFANPTVIIHHAPDQEKIDSIKQARKKLKK